ncbi:MAG: hypothetical protein IKC49_01245 [Clostridia bacterium]|nr:hypothetical protein [Clostridia bacterium]
MENRANMLLKERKKLVKKIIWTERILAWKNFWYDHFKPDETMLGAILTLVSLIGVFILPVFGQFVLAGICLAILIRMASIDDVCGIGLVENDLERLMKKLAKIDEKLIELGYSEDKTNTMDQKLAKKEEVISLIEHKAESYDRKSIENKELKTAQSIERLVAHMARENEKSLNKCKQCINQEIKELNELRKEQMAQFDNFIDTLHQ